MLRRGILSGLARDTRDQVPHILSEHPEVTNIATTLYDGRDYPFAKTVSGGSDKRSGPSSRASNSSQQPSWPPPSRRHTIGHNYSKSVTQALKDGLKFEDIKEGIPATTATGTEKPKPKPTKVRVVNMDTFDCGNKMLDDLIPANLAPHVDSKGNTNSHVVVLNLASDTHPGGGWLHGASAQEEFLFYRSTLDASMPEDCPFYPFKALHVLYTPQVVVFRDSPVLPSSTHSPSPGFLAEQHCPVLPIEKRHVLSVVSCAGIRKPVLAQTKEDPPKDIYARHSEYLLTKMKIKTVLRVAKHEGHTRIVLGALGCGAFRNPPKDVAAAFKECFEEEEELRGCWEDVVFAVLDKRGEGNFEIFQEALEGLDV